jgi:sugar phosphate isomerase/epimerase
MMKLGIIALPVAESFQRAKEKGLDFIEFCINVNGSHWPLEDFLANADKLAAASKESGVAVGCVGRWGTSKIADNGGIIEEEFDNCVRLAGAAAKLGSSIFVTGCNYIEGLSMYENVTSTIKFYERLLLCVRDKGLDLATPNCRWNNYVHSDPAWSLIHGYLKDLKIKYDPSHCNYDGNQNPLGEVNRWADRIVHVHIKGTMLVDGRQYEDPPAGMDQFNWPSFIAMLYSKKYDRGLSIESHKNWSHIFASTPEEKTLADKGTDFTVKYIRQFIF